MSRYIDADALIETIRHFVDTMSVCTSTEYCTGLRFMKKQAIEAVESAPTVDAVPVTVCASCKYDGKCMFQSFVIENSQDDVPYDRNTFYCADGERRSDGK